MNTRSSSSSVPAVRAATLLKTFGSHRAVDGIDLEVAPGEVFGVLGPNGAGKTTMLKMLATLLPIDGGEAEIFGVDVRRHPHRVRQLVGVTGQYASVDENLTARENLRLFGRLQGLSSGSARRTADDLLGRFGLEEAADRPISQFSGGMRRRLDLGASLITRPPLIFLDEPTTGLDPRTRGQMWDTIRELVRDGCTVLLTTQYLDEADQLADRIAVIDHGRKVAQGTPDQLKSQVGSSTLQLRMTDAGETHLAADVVRRILQDEPVLTPEAGGLNVALLDANRAADVLIALRERGLSISTAAVQRPTLDEVFLTLTGHGTDAAAPDPELEAARMTTLTAPIETPHPAPDPTLLPDRPSLAETVSQILSMAWRATKKMRRNPEQFFDVAVQPILFTAMFAYIFGGAISGDVASYLPLIIPGILAQTALTACIATGVQLREDMDKGVFDRFKSLPIARIAPLAGPMVADLVRYGLAATLTLGMGFVMGYRPGGGVFGVLAGWLLTVFAGWSLAWIFTWLGTVARTAQSVQGISMMIMFPLTFLSNAFVPVETLPSWLARFVEVNPVSHVVSAVRDLINDGRVTGEVGWALLGCVLVIAVFAPLAVRSYGRKM